MSDFAEVEGQPAAVAVLERALATDRLASAYLFHGPSGVGKQRTAIALAVARIAGQDPTIAHRIREGHHPDVRVFRPREEGNRNLQVEVVREQILPFAQFAPFEASAAFVIFPEADVSFPEAHPEAANAILKTLEEPRPNLHFVLLAERPNRLLRTIRSRCQPLRFQPLDAAILDGLLARRGIDAAARPMAAALARGRADRAIELGESGKVDALFDRALALHRVVFEPKPGSWVLEAERIAKLAAADRELELETLALLYRDCAVMREGMPRERLAFRHRADEIEAESRRLSTAAFAAREARVRETMDAFDRNANAQTALDAMLFGLRPLV